MILFPHCSEWEMEVLKDVLNEACFCWSRREGEGLIMGTKMDSGQCGAPAGWETRCSGHVNLLSCLPPGELSSTKVDMDKGDA